METDLENLSLKLVRPQQIQVRRILFDLHAVDDHVDLQGNLLVSHINKGYFHGFDAPNAMLNDILLILLFNCWKR